MSRVYVHGRGGPGDRDSVLGRYSLDADGLTITAAYGELVWA